MVSSAQPVHGGEVFLVNLESLQKVLHLEQHRNRKHDRDHDRSQRHRVPVDRWQRFAEIASQFRGSAIFAWGRDAKEVVDLADEDHQGDPAGEPGDDRRRDQIDDPAEIEQADHQDQHPSHQSRQPDTAHPLLMGNSDQHRRHRTGRTTDLEGRPTQNADQKATDDRREQTCCRSRPTRFAEGKRQRQRHRSDGQAGNEITLEGSPVVVAEFVLPEPEQRRFVQIPPQP